MVLKLYGHAFSTCTKTVLVTLTEKDVPFELHTIDIQNGQHKTPEYLKKQPFGEIPYIEDDGLLLFESRAISRFIATKYASKGTPLIPTDLNDFAKFEQAASIETSDFFPYASQIVIERVFKKIYRNTAADEAVVATNLSKLETKLDVYETILSKQQYLAGDNITLADLFHLPYGSLLATAEVDSLENPKRPNVARWWKDISSRPSWKATLEKN